mmetsp:Transcript_3591/g.9537  ORF Transcript_3591/g.9537 Transcript_3591/m.9537 type:complete len:88 (-) Transcript_3591:2133-2396(-)
MVGRRTSGQASASSIKCECCSYCSIYAFVSTSGRDSENDTAAEQTRSGRIVNLNVDQISASSMQVFAMGTQRRHLGVVADDARLVHL